MARCCVNEACARFSGDVFAANYHWACPVQEGVAINQAGQERAFDRGFSF